MDIEVLFKIAIIGFITAIINVLLKKSDKDELTTFTTITAFVIVLIVVVDMVGGFMETLKSLFRLY